MQNRMMMKCCCGVPPSFLVYEPIFRDGIRFISIDDELAIQETIYYTDPLTGGQVIDYYNMRIAEYGEPYYAGSGLFFQQQYPVFTVPFRIPIYSNNGPTRTFGFWGIPLLADREVTALSATFDLYTLWIPPTLTDNVRCTLHALTIPVKQLGSTPDYQNYTTSFLMDVLVAPATVSPQQRFTVFEGQGSRLRFDVTTAVNSVLSNPQFNRGDLAGFWLEFDYPAHLGYIGPTFITGSDVLPPIPDSVNIQEELAAIPPFTRPVVLYLDL